ASRPRSPTSRSRRPRPDGTRRPRGALRMAMTKGRVALAAALAVAVTAAGVGAAAPERVLEAEYARQRWIAGASERDVQVGDHRWRVVEAGSGPLIVLV